MYLATNCTTVYTGYPWSTYGYTLEFVAYVQGTVSKWVTDLKLNVGL